jgi:hypothetical protein
VVKRDIGSACGHDFMTASPGQFRFSWVDLSQIDISGQQNNGRRVDVLDR